MSARQITVPYELQNCRPRANTWVRMQRCGVNRESGNNIKGLQGKLMFSLLIDWENRCKEIDTELN